MFGRPFARNDSWTVSFSRARASSNSPHPRWVTPLARKIGCRRAYSMSRPAESAAACAWTSSTFTMDFCMYNQPHRSNGTHAIIMSASRQSTINTAITMTAGVTNCLTRAGIMMEATCDRVSISRDIADAICASRLASNQPSGSCKVWSAIFSMSASHTSYTLIRYDRIMP